MLSEVVSSEVRRPVRRDKTDTQYMYVNARDLSISTAVNLKTFNN